MKVVTRLTLLTLTIFGIRALAFGVDEPLDTVGHVDLNRYKGRWYEIARLPLSWQSKCVANVTADYTSRPDSRIGVLNCCVRSDGKMTQSRGIAKTASAKDSSNSKLKVTFFWPFRADYWILDLDHDYQWALVGNPSRKNLWILSRTPTLDHEVVEGLLSQAKASGFDTRKIIMTKQTWS
jgi:apolipoprotein D and lipocalin family protein